MDEGMKGLVGSGETPDAHGVHAHGQVHQHPCIVDALGSDPGHYAGPVNHGQPFLREEPHSRQAKPLERRERVDLLSVKIHREALVKADQRPGDGGKGRKIAARADGTELANVGRHVGIQKCYDPSDQFEP